MAWPFSTNGAVEGSGYSFPHRGGYSSPGPVPGPSRGILHRLRQISAGWLGPRQSQGTSVAKRLKEEQLAAGPRGIFDLPWFLPYYDNYTQETPEMRQAYRTMWADSNVKAACQGKIFSVAALDLKFLPADKNDKHCKRHAEWCDYLFNERIRGGMPEVAWSILSGACTDGYSVNEKVWGVEDQGEWDGYWGIHALKPKDTLNDLTLQTDEFRNITGILGLRFNAGQEFAPASFVIFRHMPLYDQPIGISDFRSVYKDFWMLDTAKKLHVIGVEKRSYPFMLGQWKNATDQPGLEGMLAKAKWQNWASAPDTAKVEVVDLAGQGHEIFSQFEKDRKHDIFLGLRGAVLQSLEGMVSDAHGSSQVHKETSQLIDWYLAACLVATFNNKDNGLVRDVCDVNFIATKGYPKADLSAVDLNEMKAYADIYNILSQFLPLSKEDLYERFNVTPPKNQQDAIMPRQQQQGMGGGMGMGGDTAGGNGAAPPDPGKLFAEISGMTAQPQLLEGRMKSIFDKKADLTEKYGEETAAAILRAAANVADKRGQTLAESFAEPRRSYGGGHMVPKIVVEPNIQVHVPPLAMPKIEVNVPKQPPAKIEVKVPRQAAPIVNLSPKIVVDVPKSEPVIKLDVKPTPITIEPSKLEIEAPKKPTSFTIKHNSEGRATELVPHYD